MVCVSFFLSLCITNIYISILCFSRFFVVGCLLFRRCSLSFRNLLSCHTVSRVCHCQSHSDEQSANIDYENFKTFGCSLGNRIESYFVCMQYKTKKNEKRKRRKNVTLYGTTRSHSRIQIK